MITHIVFFKLKDRSEENVAKTRDVLAAMEGKIPVLRHFEVGTDVLHSERSYDLALVAKFDSLDDLQVYQVHPVHQEVITYINSVKDTVIAVDYEMDK
jgi:hypothetical protein